MSTEQQPDILAAETPAADITQPDIIQQVTSPEPKTQPTKNPKRVAAGKMVAERTKKAREEQKKAASDAAVNEAKKAQKAPATSLLATEGNAISPSSLSTTQWLAVGSIVVSLVGIYYKREELKAFYNKRVAPQHTQQQPAPVEPEPEPATVAQPRKGGLIKMN